MGSSFKPAQLLFYVGGMQAIYLPSCSGAIFVSYNNILYWYWQRASGECLTSQIGRRSCILYQKCVRMCYLFWRPALNCRHIDKTIFSWLINLFWSPVPFHPLSPQLSPHKINCPFHSNKYYRNYNFICSK